MNMSINMQALRRIKPLGSVDDYVAGDMIGCTRAEAGEMFLESLLSAIKVKAKSVPELAKLTGRSRAAVSRRLTTQVSKKTVTTKKVKLAGAQRPVNYYSLVEAA